MSTDTYSIQQAKQQFSRLAKTKSVVTVTNRGEISCFIVPKELMVALFETQEILANPFAMEQVAAYRAGTLSFRPLDAIPD